MWLFTTKGFVSVVEDYERPGNLLVRGRFKGDIPKIFPDVKEQYTRNRDYRYRASLPRETVAARIAELLLAINYPNFKDACPDDRHALHGQVWGTMYNAQNKQDRRARPKRGKAPPLNAPDLYDFPNSESFFDFRK